MSLSHTDPLSARTPPTHQTSNPQHCKDPAQTVTPPPAPATQPQIEDAEVERVKAAILKNLAGKSALASVHYDSLATDLARAAISLERKACIRKTDRTRPTRSGRQAAVWVVQEAA